MHNIISNYLCILINKYQPDIIALQETRFKNNNQFDINHYICIMKNRNSAAGGVAMYCTLQIVYQLKQSILIRFMRQYCNPSFNGYKNHNL